MTYEEFKAYQRSIGVWPLSKEATYNAARAMRPATALDAPVTAQFEGMSEAAIQQRVRLDASRKGWLIMRNNVGAFMDERGVPVRYGLANDTKEMNRNIKSSDLIGVKPVVITADMVGQVIGQFVALEVKHGDWKYTGNEHEMAQKRFIDLVKEKGGDGRFVTGLL